MLARLSPDERAGPRGEKLSGMCLRALQRLRFLVEDHFLAERLEAGGIPFRLEAVQLHEAITASSARARTASVATDLDDALAAWADRSMLERLLEGVLALAARSTGSCAVEGRRSGAMALLRVTGDPPLPDAFTRPQKGTASDPTGRVLGAFVAAEIARALGGSLSASGGAYVLLLPLPPAEPGEEPSR